MCVVHRWGMAAWVAWTILSMSGSSAQAAGTKPGETIFHRECVVCHGDHGFGDGPASSLMHPRPRNFQQGLFKLRSTESGELPTDEDLVRTVTNGIPGTGMPSFRDLDKKDILAVVGFLKTLGGPEDEDGSWFELYDVPPPAEVAPMPAGGESQLASGKLLYSKMGCAGCHGKAGKGDGKPAEEMKDNWGEPLHARNFVLGVYKGGARPEDLYLRVMTGMDGTPMTGFWKDAMTAQERWDIVHYIMSLGEPHEVRQPSRRTLEVSRSGLPSSAHESAWKGIPKLRLGRLALSGGWMRRFAPIEFQAVEDDGTLALRASWDDGPNSCASLRIGFAPADPAATFLVGSGKNPISVWRWNPEAGGSVVVSSGPDRETATQNKLAVRQSRQGQRYTVMLTGARPAAARQVRVAVSGCTPRGRYRTSSTVHRLH